MNSEPTLDGTVRQEGNLWADPANFTLYHAGAINLSDEQAADLIRCLPESRGLLQVMGGEKGMRWQFTNGLTLDYEGHTKEFWLRSDGPQFEPGAFLIMETTNTPVPDYTERPISETKIIEGSLGAALDGPNAFTIRNPDYAVEPKCIESCEVLSGNILHAPGCPNIAAENLGEVDEGVIVETRKPSEVYDPLTPGGGVANALRFGDPLGPDADKDMP